MLSDTLRAVLAGSPDLLNTPSIALEIAQGSTATNTDPFGSAMGASLAAVVAALNAESTDREALGAPA